MVDLFCTACDSQIGTYENEWIRLTSSYIIPRVNGTKFGIIVADEHRTVDGKEATALHGCDLSEASCSKCSKAIGHFCRHAPGKPHLVGQYIYKLSKTHLKLAQTSTQVAYNLVFGANQPQQDRARSMFTAPPRPVQPSSPYQHTVHNEAARKSMGPPSSRPNSGLLIDPALAAPVSASLNNRENSTSSAELAREEKGIVRENNLILRRLEEQDDKLSKISESIHDWKIQNGKLLAALMRSSPQTLTAQDASGVLETMMDDFEFMVNAAYEARSGNDELENLRAENESMKAKLQTIALAMGPATAHTPPASQPLTSPMTASSTPSVLGKRKRTDARGRHSLLQNEVSFTDDDGLNDQSRLYGFSNALYMTSTPAQQSELLSTPFLLNAGVGPQHRQTPAMTTVTTSKPIAVPIEGSHTLAKTTGQILTPPDSSFAERHGRESRSTDPDHSLDMEPDYSSNTSPEASGSTHSANADFDLSHNTDVSEILERQVTGTKTVEDATDGHQWTSAPSSRPQRASNPTLKDAAADDTLEPEYATVTSELRQKSRASLTKDQVADLHDKESITSATNLPRRNTTNLLPQEAHSRHETNVDKEQRRQTTSALLEPVSVHSRDLGGLTGPQRVTRAAATQADFTQETGNESGDAEVHKQISAKVVDADLWQDSSLMPLTNDEEREELFERRPDDQRETQMNSNNKENEQPYYAHSADGAQSKQLSRRNRDPNKPKRARRKPDEIKRKYKCLFPGCTKAYGELPHLNTHITDSSHGERWVKADYLEASKKQDNNVDDGMDQDDGLDLDRIVEERNAAEAVAALERNQDRVDRVKKLRQRDLMAKEAMEREELMELGNGV